VMTLCLGYSHLWLVNDLVTLFTYVFLEHSSLTSIKFINNIDTIRWLILSILKQIGFPDFFQFQRIRFIIQFNFISFYLKNCLKPSVISDLSLKYAYLYQYLSFLLWSLFSIHLGPYLFTTFYFFIRYSQPEQQRIFLISLS
jgi:hypothetical protein